MKTSITVELDGVSFALEESAWHALRSYLDRAAARLGNHPDKLEVLAGLERSIGAKLARGTGDRTTPLSGPEMAAALREVGRVDGPQLASAPAGFSWGGGNFERPRPLYRLTEGQQIAGVCTGLAAFADIDVGLVRLIFILLTVFSGGVAVLGYVLMMFLVPVARTPEQVAAARGAVPSA
jgi:phage shock protein PspC (stress-responsive transcriptional regulator)